MCHQFARRHVRALLSFHSEPASEDHDEAQRARMYMQRITLHPHQLRDIRLAADPFSIYASRRILQRAGIACAVYRGDEWWHCQVSDHWPGETSRTWELMLE